ncbi:MAG: glycosyltransferase family 39 protein [Nibricoccus sp.]
MPGPSLSQRSTFWGLLVFGVALRCVSIFEPLVDGHLLRQAQTAAATQSLAHQPGLPLSYNIPWIGDLDAHYVQEIPIYNYLVIGLYKVSGNLDAAGKLTSIGLWVISFILLQRIWKRCLPEPAIFWANLLFVLSPQEIFYGQAFMPEMLVQVFSFGFLVAGLRYLEHASLGQWVLCVFAGLLAFLTKLPATSHLLIPFAILLYKREGNAAFSRVRYWITAALAPVILIAWSHYVEHINNVSLPEWSPRNSLLNFIGTPSERLNPKPWVVLGAYLVTLSVPGFAALFTAVGVWFSRRKQEFQFLHLWLASLLLFYVLWFGNTGAKQGYYNLVAIGPLSAFFGIGLASTLESDCFRAKRRLWSALAVALVVGSAIPGTLYLFKKDRVILTAAVWTRDHIPEKEVVLFRPNHRWDMVDYPYNAVFPYYSGHPTFVYTGQTSEHLKSLALERAHYAVVTFPPAAPDSWFWRVFQRFRGTPLVTTDSLEWLSHAGFRPSYTGSNFAVYKRE